MASTSIPFSRSRSRHPPQGPSTTAAAAATAPAAPPAAAAAPTTKTTFTWLHRTTPRSTNTSLSRKFSKNQRSKHEPWCSFKNGSYNKETNNHKNKFCSFSSLGVLLLLVVMGYSLANSNIKVFATLPHDSLLLSSSSSSRVLVNHETNNNNNDNQGNTADNHNHKVFELYHDFDLTEFITGNETWHDLIRYRRDANHPTLAFYVDKIARRRSLEATRTAKTIHQITTDKDWFIPTPHTLAMTYASELPLSSQERRQRILEQILPPMTTTTTTVPMDWVAKSTHLSCSANVWITRWNATTGEMWVANGKTLFQPASQVNFSRTQVAHQLAESLETVQTLCAGKVPESRALQQVQPGILVEERFTSWENPYDNTNNHNDNDNNNETNDTTSGDDGGGLEFKVFTIWGKAWMIIYRPGYDGVGGFFYPNGTAMPWQPTPPPQPKQDRQQEHPQTKKNKNHAKNPERDSHHSRTTTTRTTKKKATRVKLPDMPPPIPSWLNCWPRLVTIAERLGAHKDMFRTDILVGIPASKRAELMRLEAQEQTSSSQYHRQNENNITVTTEAAATTTTSTRDWKVLWRQAVVLAVSETEIFPTPYDQAETMRKFEEGTRLWLEGYQRPGFYTVVPNREVPHSFVQARGLSTTAAAQVVF
ncbi:hypothetical protein ACA910_019165 [Epithemia clementina (nom. ined.)]